MKGQRPICALTSRRNSTPQAHTQTGIDATQHHPIYIFQKLPRYEVEPLLNEKDEEVHARCVTQRVPSGVQGLATPILQEVEMMPNENEAIIIATLRCVAHIDSVEVSEHVAPAGMLDCSTLVAIYNTRCRLLLETMGVRPAADTGGAGISRTAISSNLFVWKHQRKRPFRL